MNNALLWHGDTKRLYRFRVAQLYIGDSLVCDTTNWRVDCIEDENRLGDRLFIVTKNGEEMVRRKRVDSIVEFLSRNEAPETLEYVSEGALHLMKPRRLDNIELLGFLPGYDGVVKENIRTRSGRLEQKRRKGLPILSQLKPMTHRVIRFVIQDNQATWFNRAYQTACC